jgi:hypothetical protein
MARGREPAGKPVMQEVLLRRAYYPTGAVGARRDAFAEDEDLGGIGRPATAGAEPSLSREPSSP